MPRINTQGITDARLEEPDVYLRQPRENEEESPEWHGNSSSPSTGSKRTDSEKSEKSDPNPVRTTEPRSKVEKTDSSTARGTAGRTASK